jgi:hypothetical protein
MEAILLDEILRYLPIILRVVGAAIAIYGYNRCRLKFAIFFFVGAILPELWFPFSRLLSAKIYSASQRTLIEIWFYGETTIEVVAGICLLLGIILAIKQLRVQKTLPGPVALQPQFSNEALND